MFIIVKFIMSLFLCLSLTLSAQVKKLSYFSSLFSDTQSLVPIRLYALVVFILKVFLFLLTLLLVILLVGSLSSCALETNWVDGIRLDGLL